MPLWGGKSVAPAHSAFPGTRVSKRGHFPKRNLCPVFRQRVGGQRGFFLVLLLLFVCFVLFRSALSQLPAAPNNPYAKVASFRVMYSDPLQNQGFSVI